MFLTVLSAFVASVTAQSMTIATAPASSSVSTSPTVTAAASTGSVVKQNHLTYSATYTPGPNGNLPNTSEEGQYGTNNCGTASNPDSLCQNVFINSVEDFCVFGPPYSNGKNATIGETERIEVSWCTQAGYGTRVMPDGTITGAHFVMTPDYVQVTGWGDFTKIGIPNGDYGGELDPHGYDGNGNPIGGLVFGNSYGVMQQYHEWTNFMSFNQFCIRACNPDGPNPAGLCQHIYDLQGCNWNMPGNYDNGYFEDCLGDSSLPMGVYGTSTWYQSIQPTPPAHPVPSSSSCVRVATITSGSIAPTTDSFSTVFTSVASAGSTITYVEDVITLGSTTSVPTQSASAGSGGSSGSSSGSGSGSGSSHSGASGMIGSAPIIATAVLGLGMIAGLFLAA